MRRLPFWGRDSFEQTTENDRLIIAAPEESASLTGSLASLRELESSGIRTLVFRTRHCESSVRLADLTAQGSDEAVVCPEPQRRERQPDP